MNTGYIDIFFFQFNLWFIIVQLNWGHCSLEKVSLERQLFPTKYLKSFEDAYVILNYYIYKCKKTSYLKPKDSSSKKVFHNKMYLKLSGSWLCFIWAFISNLKQILVKQKTATNQF